MPMIDKQAVARSFSKAADSYDAFAFLQREIGERLFERLELMKVAPELVVDIGCGTGHFTRQLNKRYRKANVTGVDIAPGMIEFAKKKNTWLNRCDYQVADMDRLPFADNSVDLLFSNLAIQWVSDPAATFREFARVIRPNGLIIYSTLGPDTLKELKAAWQAVDEQPHVNEFIDMHDLGDAMLQAPFSDPVMDMEMIELTYESLSSLFKDLKGIGAHNIHNERSKSLMTKGKWRAMLSAYDSFKNDDEQYIATYEAIYGHGWGKEQPSSDLYRVSLK